MEDRANPPAPSGLAPHRLQRVLELIDERLADPLQVRELAATAGLSPFHFARMFKLATGKPPHAYITAQRMEKAKLLLGASDLPLCDVAAHVGYQTQAHFTGVFHRRVGVTPRVYRRAVKARSGAGSAVVPVGARVRAPQGGNRDLGRAGPQLGEHPASARAARPRGEELARQGARMGESLKIHSAVSVGVPGGEDDRVVASDNLSSAR